MVDALLRLDDDDMAAATVAACEAMGALASAKPKAQR